MDLAGTAYHLKKMLMDDVGFFERDFLYRAAVEGAKNSFKGMGTHGVPRNPREVLEKTLEMMRRRGYGDLKIAEFDPKNYVVVLTAKDSAEAWAFQVNRDLQRTPVCSYTSGALSVACQMSFVGDTKDEVFFKTHEIDCAGIGSEECRWVVGPADEITKRYPDSAKHKETVSEHDLKLNEEILGKNLELQGLNLELERQIRKRTEDLWRTEENYESLMKLSPDPIMLISIPGRINAMNPAGYKMLGYDTSEELPDLNIGSLLTGREHAWEKVLWFIEKESHVSGMELELTRKDGKRISGQLNARYADLASGRSVEAVFKDVTEKKEMEEQIREAQSETEFLNELLSHDIINSTISALHFLGVAIKTPGIAPEIKSKLQVATKDIQSMFDLAASVRDLSRVKAEGNDPPELIKDLQMLVSEAIEESRAMYFDRKIIFNFQKTAEPKYVAAGTIASRIFTNLLTNAIKFDQHDEVVVDITIVPAGEPATPFWQVRIADNGIGIPDEDKERMFEKFERGETTVKGTGLGLFVARMITDAYKGKIWAANRIPGDHAKGTTMVVQLPRADEKRIAQLRTRVSTG